MSSRICPSASHELLKANRQQNPGVKLYEVGDDWQSIFSFTGSDISIITQFKEHFGFTSQTAILQTFRFNEQILAASSSFIQQNPAQIRNQLTTHHQAPEGTPASSSTQPPRPRF